jgi:hypothetical protein
MAIVQVSRITQRQGLAEDLPQPLAGAELGWAVDERRLYIGNGSLDEGAPVVGNTEILTEFSDILGYATLYTYQGERAGYTVQTGSTVGNPVTQSLQTWLDSFAIVTDFGATGDGVTDDTEAINRALFQLYCVQANPQIRRGLFFPAGVYKVSDSILIPPYAKLYGEGAESSIVRFVVDIWAANTAYAQGVLVQYEDPISSIVTYYRSKIPVLPTGIGLDNDTYWDSQSLPNWVFQTADSRGQTGVNIGTGGATFPIKVEISSMSWQTTEFGNDSSLGHNIGLLEKLQQGYFDSVNFIGPLQESNLDSAVENLSGIVFDSSAAVPCEQITFDKCRFQGMTYGINTDNFVKGITVSNGWFDTLYQGIVLGDNAPADGGPQGFRIMHNSFDKIYAEGVVIENCSLNATGYNSFYDVGNQFNGNNFPFSPVITINAANNISVGDMFARTDAQTQLGVGYPRIRLYNSGSSSIPQSIAFTNGVQMQLGTYVRKSGVQEEIQDGFADQTLFTVNSAISLQNGGYDSFTMNYTIKRVSNTGALAVRNGVLVATIAPDDGSSAVAPIYSDDYTENEHTDVNLSVSQSGTVITVSYTAAATGFDGTIYYSVNYQA